MKYRFPGKTLRTKRAGPFRITESAYAPNNVLPLHQHDSPYISFLLSGEYMESNGARELSCGAGMVLWHPAFDAHADRFGVAGGHMLNLEMSQAWLAEARQELKPLSSVYGFQDGLPYALGLRLYRALGRECLELDDLACELTSFFFAGRADIRPPKWLQRVRELVEQQSDKTLSLSATAAEAGVHPVHLARTCRRFWSCTFGDYLARVRLRKALGMLGAGGSQSVADIAYASGFADHAHLCRKFKESTGFTPSAFRRHIDRRV